MLKAMEVHSNIKDGVSAVLIKLDVRTAIELAAYLLKQSTKARTHRQPNRVAVRKSFCASGQEARIKAGGGATEGPKSTRSDVLICSLPTIEQ